jgi:hypothetical protein
VARSLVRAVTRTWRTLLPAGKWYSPFAAQWVSGLGVGMHLIGNDRAMSQDEVRALYDALITGERSCLSSQPGAAP